MSGELAVIDPKAATAEQCRTYAISIREVIESLTEGQLDELEAVLVGVAKRLRQLKGDAAQAEASRVMTLRQIGKLLGPAQRGGDRHSGEFISQKEEMNLTKADHQRRWTARLLAEFPELVDNMIATELARDTPRVSMSRLTKLCQRKRSAREMPMLGRRYAILYVDPPWQYEGAESGTRQIENQYGTMPLDDIKRLKVPAADDAVLFFWVTSPKLADGLAVLRAWEFDYRTCMVWVKDKIGMGYYARQQHELLLIAKRGELPVPAPENRPSSVFDGTRSEHSAKPEHVYELIEAMYPEYERSEDATDFCELFARGTRKGWAPWGNEVPA